MNFFFAWIQPKNDIWSDRCCGCLWLLWIFRAFEILFLLLPSKKSISRSQEEFPTAVQGCTKEICQKLALKYSYNVLQCLSVSFVWLSTVSLCECVKVCNFVCYAERTRNWAALEKAEILSFYGQEETGGQKSYLLKLFVT